MTKSYTALGLMSGTSLDGVDGAFLETDGEHILRFGPALGVSYSQTNRETLEQTTRAALRWQFNGAPPNSFGAAEHVIETTHANIIEEMISADANWANNLRLLGFHGQTVLHQPPIGGKVGKTVQLGNGQVLADRFGVPCVFDFRTKDVAAGGQGAPLAPIYHKALVEYSELEGVSAVLNLGGVGNVTLVGPGILKATDTGPANGPLDSWMERNGHMRDENGRTSRLGQVDFGRVGEWLSRDFFQRPVPRSADRYDFDVVPEMSAMSLRDGAATLCAYAVGGVRDSLKHLGNKPDRLIVCGGGRHNLTLMNMLALEIGCEILTAEQVGWNSDMIEAQAFAYLAVRSHLGLPISFPDTTGVPKPMTGGLTAYPSSGPLGSRGGQ